MGSCKENGCIAWGDERCKSPFYNGGLMLCEVDDRIKSLESERDAARAEVAELKKRLECPAVEWKGLSAFTIMGQVGRVECTDRGAGCNYHALTSIHGTQIYTNSEWGLINCGLGEAKWEVERAWQKFWQDIHNGSGK